MGLEINAVTGTMMFIFPARQTFIWILLSKTDKDIEIVVYKSLELKLYI